MKRNDPYWTESRGTGDKLASGVGILSLKDADPVTFPWVVITSRSVSVLGEMVCLCAFKVEADRITEALNQITKIKEIVWQKPD